MKTRGGCPWFRVKQHRGGFSKPPETFLGNLLGTSRLTFLIGKGSQNDFSAGFMIRKGFPK